MLVNSTRLGAIRMPSPVILLDTIKTLLGGNLMVCGQVYLMQKQELDPPPWLNRMRELGYPPGCLDIKRSWSLANMEKSEYSTLIHLTCSYESKERIAANLANFAYDPYNYTFLHQLNVLELFLDCMTEPNEKLVEFGAGEICNSCAAMLILFKPMDGFIGIQQMLQLLPSVMEFLFLYNVCRVLSRTRNNFSLQMEKRKRDDEHLRNIINSASTRFGLTKCTWQA